MKDGHINICSKRDAEKWCRRWVEGEITFYCGESGNFVMKEVAITIKLEGWKISWHMKEMVRKIIVLREAEAGKQWNVQIRSEDRVIISIFIQS